MTDNKIVSKRKPARVQLDPSVVNADGKPEQTGQVFNIWYSKWTGGETNGKALLTHSKTRCVVKRDQGYTRADKYTKEGSVNRDKFVCLYFARGYCCNGRNCDYLHRIPTDLDFFPPTLDCFGREKFSEYRDDMSGIGSFNNVNRTLYVGRINSMDGNIELLINKNFGEFGQIERMRAVKEKKIAFITFKLESQAQFAKEAMHGQSLVENNESEALNIRWANEDPDPRSQKRKAKELEQNALETAKKLLKTMQASKRITSDSDSEPNAGETLRIEQKHQQVESHEDEPEHVTETEDTGPKENQVVDGHEQKSDFFENKSLDVLRALQLKRASDVVATANVTEKESLESMMQGYGSSSENESE